MKHEDTKNSSIGERSPQPQSDLLRDVGQEIWAEVG